MGMGKIRGIDEEESAAVYMKNIISLLTLVNMSRVGASLLKKPSVPGYRPFPRSIRIIYSLDVIPHSMLLLLWMCFFIKN